MKRNVVVASCTFLAALAIVASSVQLNAKEDDKKKAGAAGQKETGGDDQKAAEEQYAQMMEMMKKMGAVGPAHEVLHKLAGSWEAECTMFTPTGTETSKGSSKVETILDGRYIQETFRGEFDGEPFEGLGFTGFDNQKQQYTGVWLDSMSTTVFIHYGAYDAQSKTFTYEGECDDPVMGKTKNRSVLRMESPDRRVFEMYSVGPDGKDMKQMEIVYTRK